MKEGFPMRREILLNDGWLFHKGDIDYGTPPVKGLVYAQSKTERKLVGPASYDYYDRPDPYYAPGRAMNCEKWEYVSVPHDYVINQDFCKDENNALGYCKYENAWYRKHFTVENAKCKRVLLRFDGIAGEATVYLNGCLMCRNFSRYNTFEVDISDYVYHDKENILAVYVNSKSFEGWWYQGGGIYRNVYLTVTDAVAIDLWGVYAPAAKLDDTTWEINFETTLVNSLYEDTSVHVESFVTNQDGECVAKTSADGEIPSREKTTLKYSCKVTHPLLWDCDSPNLYSIKTVVIRNGEEVDESHTRIGLRTVEVSVEKGLLLNGKKTIIKGVCSHQDFGLTGLAVPDNIARYKVKLIKEMGANGYRTSHYQQTESYMDAFDEMGFLVMDEARWFESTNEALMQLESLVKRDRNRPSVIFWSTGNEEPTQVTETGKNIHRAIYAHIRKLDKTRIIMSAQDKKPENSTVFEYSDIIGINYNLDSYDKVHENHPDKAIVASECCAVGRTRDWNFDSNSLGRLRDIDTDANEWFLGREKTWKFLMSRPYVIGAYQWAAVEHRGEAVWPALCSKSGALDLFLQKKGAFYQNKSHWTHEPMVHIVPHWNFSGLEGQEIPVTVYTNCDELELFLNGKSLGRKQIEKYGHGLWLVPYEAGKLEVNGYSGGKICVTDERQTTGKPEKLRLTQINEFECNGKDVALFTCECLDSEGRTVPDASELVRFSVSSPAVIIGTGSDNCDPLNVSNPERRMYMGKITVAVKPAKNTGFTLTAYSGNCTSDILVAKV